MKGILHEHVPAGTRWAFTFGSVLVFLLLVEFMTGLGLTLYYAPTPDHAWDSINYIATHVRAGAFLLGLHYWTTRLIVIVLALHLARIVLMGSYQKPRHTNWVIGVLLFLVVLGFAITGLLLRWDQGAYWATVVRIGIAKLAPGLGGMAADLMRGGPDIGALTLTRWYAAHAIVLPVVLIALVVAHLRLRVRDGLSGPVVAKEGPLQRYFPHQAARDLTAVAIVGAVLVALAIHGAAPLEAPADPTSTAYIPRPEWYFAWLFQFVKYFPGKLEALGAIIIPTIALVLLIALPWFDSGKTRHWRGRRAILLAFGFLGSGVVVLTTIGSLDTVARSGPSWNPREKAGAVLIASDRCTRCHKEDGAAPPIQAGRIARPADWLSAHIADPEMIAPGLREPPPTNERDNTAVLAALGRLHGSAAPAMTPDEEQVATLLNRRCLSCHVVDGVGGKDGPELSHVGAKANEQAIAARIANPKSVMPDAQMPAFGSRLSPQEITLLSQWLAARK